jgi:hypothetical protein
MSRNACWQRIIRYVKKSSNQKLGITSSEDKEYLGQKMGETIFLLLFKSDEKRAHFEQQFDQIFQNSFGN